MKDESQETIESALPDMYAEDAVDFALKKIYKDDQRCLEDEVVDGLTFEELVGALRLAQEHINPYT